MKKNSEQYDDIIRQVDSGDFNSNLRHVLFPSILAGLSIAVMAYLWNMAHFGIIFASFGSSAFIVYVTPKSPQADLRNILGAYPLAGFFGYLSASYFVPNIHLVDVQFDYAVAGGIAVCLTVLAMLITRFEHAPAAGAALAFVIKTPEVDAVFFLIGGGITLLVLTRIFTFVVKEEYELEKAIRESLHLSGKK